MDELGFLPVRLRRRGGELTRSIGNLQIGLEFGGKINKLWASVQMLMVSVLGSNRWATNKFKRPFPDNYAATLRFYIQTKQNLIHLLLIVKQ